MVAGRVRIAPLYKEHCTEDKGLRTDMMDRLTVEVSVQQRPCSAWEYRQACVIIWNNKASKSN